MTKTNIKRPEGESYIGGERVAYWRQDADGRWNEAITESGRPFRRVTDGATNWEPIERVAEIQGRIEEIVTPRELDRILAYLYDNFRLDLQQERPRIIGTSVAGFTFEAQLERLASGLIIAEEVTS